MVYQLQLSLEKKVKQRSGRRIEKKNDMQTIRWPDVWSTPKMDMGEGNVDIYSKGKNERAVLGKRENFNLVEQVVPLLRVSKENVT